MGEILEEFSCKGMDGKAELEKHGRQHVVSGAPKLLPRLDPQAIQF